VEAAEVAIYIQFRLLVVKIALPFVLNEGRCREQRLIYRSV
jgi:hypothetical protein